MDGLDRQDRYVAAIIGVDFAAARQAGRSAQFGPKGLRLSFAVGAAGAALLLPPAKTERDATVMAAASGVQQAAVLLDAPAGPLPGPSLIASPSLALSPPIVAASDASKHRDIARSSIGGSLDEPQAIAPLNQARHAQRHHRPRGLPIAPLAVASRPQDLATEGAQVQAAAEARQTEVRAARLEAADAVRLLRQR